MRHRLSFGRKPPLTVSCVKSTMSEETDTHAEPTPWSTVTARSRRTSGATRAALAELADLLDALGGLIADHEAVGGVEFRDPTTFDGPERAELVTYTTPEARDEVETRVCKLVQDLGIAEQVEVSSETHTDDSWRDGWKAFYRPLRYGDGALLVRPSWIARDPDDPEHEIVLDPGRAFGTGQHETTHLCLEAIVDLRERGAMTPSRILDLGCGSGILLLGAARLWPDAGDLVAIDVDPEAVATTEENAALNDLSSRVQAAAGDVHHRVASAPFDLVLANIRPEVLVPQAAAITGRLADHADARLVLSGILDVERDRVLHAYLAQGLELVGEPRAQGEWVALTMARP